MPLKIETFKERSWRPGGNFGGSTLFKALGHPIACQHAHQLVDQLKIAGPVAVYDPLGHLSDFEVLYPLNDCNITDSFVQDVTQIGSAISGCIAQPITNLINCKALTLFVAAFDSDRLCDHIRHLVPNHMKLVSFDEIRLPREWLSNPSKYLSPINFATNFAFFRDNDELHTAVRTVNYWSGYGASEVELWLSLFDNNGKVLASWSETLSSSANSIAIDSKEVRRRFNLGEFYGSLFIHALRIKGHDVVKYAIDIFSDERDIISSTHDANAWPADLYAGVPAPRKEERVILWIQNSHPITIPKGSVGINSMGSKNIVRLDQDIPPFGTLGLDLGATLPSVQWPTQIEVQAGRYFVRPRYEVEHKDGHRRIAHANVERTDLSPDPNIPKLGSIFGKGYILPLPILPLAEFKTLTLPTPMASTQTELPIRCMLVDASGETVTEKFLGKILRHDSIIVDVDSWLLSESIKLPSGYGHLEFLYDFQEGGEADGWLHAIGRYQSRHSTHAAETSFGAHIFNTPIIYRDEPQSYTSQPPGVTTRLFLRIANSNLETMCHLIYPASLPWKEYSDTQIILHNDDGEIIDTISFKIPCGGSLHWRFRDTFDISARKEAGNNAYVIVRDTTCRLFGYHGILSKFNAFCIDHMFGF